MISWKNNNNNNKVIKIFLMRSRNHLKPFINNPKKCSERKAENLCKFNTTVKNEAFETWRKKKKNKTKNLKQKK